MLYSADLEIFEGEVPPSIKEAIVEIKEFLHINDIQILNFDEFNLAIPIEIEINLPSKGTYENIDIRSLEPVLLVFSLQGYPTTSPKIKSDRKDFPSSKLSHLYAVKQDSPPTLCLVRENLDEWFANRRISDFISVGKQWFSKASNGLLSEDADEFEPVRLEGYRGYSVYSYIKLYNQVYENSRHIDEYPFCYQLFTTKEKDTFHPTFKRFDLNVTKQIFDPLYRKIAEFNVKKIKENSNDNDVDFPLFGLLVWSNTSDAISEYSTSLPKTYEELEAFGKENLVSIKEPVEEYLKDNALINNLTSFIPIIIAVKRPKKLIGFESDIEFFHFVIYTKPESIQENIISPDTEVFFQAHREVISSRLAQKLSVSNNLDKTLFIGAGALGSKLLFHFARRGNFNLTAIDNDKFSPHNIVRHDLFMESTGVNKAKAVIEKIKAFLDDNSSLQYKESSLFYLKKESLEGYNWLIDTSASLNVQNWLVNSKLNEIPNRARSEIAYKGDLGFLYIEGEKQNPRIDDLVNYVYFLGIHNRVISEWLVEENKKKEGNDYDIVDIGIGCNSPTVIMSNDSMSFHAAIFSKILNNEFDRKSIGKNGLLNISYISTDGFKLDSSSYLVPTLGIFQCQNNSGWEIRLVRGVLESMKHEASRHRKNETGGVFIGICNYKTKTIHVFDTIVAPADSRHNPIYFYRGIENLPEQVKQIKEITGGMIGYIGEWHTHPMGLDSLSGVDMAAVEKLKPLNDSYPIPTFISILSKEKYLPFVF
ncbi:MAG: ThiF family adenylyltransferase [Bacteroidales bacterium]|nr:ThiF family adenylyltransferase [Bacteroidales bacterium]